MYDSFGDLVSFRGYLFDFFGIKEFLRRSFKFFFFGKLVFLWSKGIRVGRVREEGRVIGRV